MATGVGRGFAIEPGVEIEAKGRYFIIDHVLDVDAVMVRDVTTNESERMAIADLQPRTTSAVAPKPLPDLTQLDDADWDEARRRRDAIKPLIAMPRPPRSLIAEHARAFGVSAATMYRWMRTFLTSGNKLSALLPVKRNGGRGKRRLPPEIDAIIDTAIEHFYLTKQQHSVKGTADEVARLCRNAGLPAPHASTVGRRILAVSERTRLRRRNHGKRVDDRLEARPGHYTEAQRPLQIVQIDHTKLDVMVVDEVTRLSVGRPWITLAIDLFSRMVVGFYISLDPPGANNTGLCIAHAVLGKETWLAKHGISTSWPCWGFPVTLHLDNAKEFRGEMLQRACDQYDIELVYRPIANPHFGPFVERIMRTLATEIHKLPGTTFSNPGEKGTYNSEKEAVLTLSELEGYVAEYITGIYHQKVHSGIGVSPILKWKQAILGTATTRGMGHPLRPSDPERIRLDFMPFQKRTVQNYGVKIDGINYYSDVLRRYMSSPSNSRKPYYIFRRDPADISRIYFWDAETKQYYEIPYRDMRRPSMSVWELREVTRRLRDEGKSEADEGLIFETFEHLRKRREEATAETKHTRRRRSRKRNAEVFRSKARESGVAAIEKIGAPHLSIFDEPIIPFDVDRG